MRQRFSNASWAAGDSPCASSTTLQCVVVNIAAPPDAEPVALGEVTSSAAALTLESQSKGVLKASLHVTEQTLGSGGVIYQLTLGAANSDRSR